MRRSPSSPSPRLPRAGDIQIGDHRSDSTTATYIWRPTSSGAASPTIEPGADRSPRTSGRSRTRGSSRVTHSARVNGGYRSIDIAAVALFAELTVDAVSDLDLSYTPPFGSPWDAIQVAAQNWSREHDRLPAAAS